MLHSKHLVSALAGAGMLAGSVAFAAEVETDTLSMSLGVDLPFLPHIVAFEKGWFADAGFTNVEFKKFNSGAQAGEALLADEIQLWTPGNLPPISMAHNGVPVVILGTNSVNYGLEKIVVRKDANVTKPEDLYDTKLGLLRGGRGSQLLCPASACRQRLRRVRACFVAHAASICLLLAVLRTHLMASCPCKSSRKVGVVP